MHDYLQGLPRDAAGMLASRVIRVSVLPDPANSDQSKSVWFKVVTSPVGFINHFSTISNIPNCVLKWKEGIVLGQHNLVIEATRTIKANKQWLLNYGPLHPCGPRKPLMPRRGLKRKSEKTPELVLQEKGTGSSQPAPAPS